MRLREHVPRKTRGDFTRTTRIICQPLEEGLRGGVVIGDRGGQPFAILIGWQLQPALEHLKRDPFAPLIRQNPDLPDKCCLRFCGGVVAQNGSYQSTGLLGDQTGVREVGGQQEVAIRRVRLQMAGGLDKLPDCCAVPGFGGAKVKWGDRGRGVPAGCLHQFGVPVCDAAVWP